VHLVALGVSHCAPAVGRSHRWRTRALCAPC
jgi:hypothetical protein